jgi:mediator of RNA polymerase II transcription subunit 14
MPGRLIMDNHGAERTSAAVNGKNGGSTLAVDGNPSTANNVTVLAKRPGSAVLANGDFGPSEYDRPAALPPHYAVNGSMQADAESSILDLPPELIEVVEGFEPLGELIRRATQLCFNRLDDTISELANMPVGPTAGSEQANGINNYSNPNRATDESRVSLLKKEKLLEYALEQRKIFVKLLVLTNWSRNISSVSKLINLSNWNAGMTWQFDSAAEDMVNIKFTTKDFKIPNSTISAAGEILASGSASWIPPLLNYIPQKPYTPQEVLQNIRNLNTSLNIRLNLHEDLPISLRDYRIANGRATFTFPNEFELDVSIGKDDPSSPLYFIDVRFLFRPAPRVGDGPIRFALDMRINEMLEKSGLPAACDFLHNWTLTQKTLTFMRQAREMQRTNWTKAIRVDPIHRVLSVQYWLDSWLPAKHWIEIGVEAGKQKHGKASWKENSRPKIVLRWHRHGNLVPDADVPSLDLQELSMEATLKKIIALHISYILRSTKDRLLEKAPADQSGERVLFANLQESDSEPSACSLQLKLGPTCPMTTLAIDGINGKFLAQPSSDIVSRLLFDLNTKLKMPAEEAHEKIAIFLSVELQYSIEKQAERRGWRPVKAKFDEKVLKASFKEDVLRHTFFKLAGWANSKWTIASIVNLSGESWWVVEL